MTTSRCRLTAIAAYPVERAYYIAEASDNRLRRQIRIRLGSGTDQHRYLRALLIAFAFFSRS